MTPEEFDGQRRFDQAINEILEAAKPKVRITNLDLRFGQHVEELKAQGFPIPEDQIEDHRNTWANAWVAALAYVTNATPHNAEHIEARTDVLLKECEKYFETPTPEPKPEAEE